ncbi:MAG: hypothetical protein L0Z50_06595, partial [Verrucomicrobiales bacterium]|nr:hypothetical protein [Verrucomicrobiales bacterium]
MKPALHHRGWIPTVLTLLLLNSPFAGGEIFLWKENVSGAFTDPNRWDTGLTPATRYPNAGDDAVLGRGPFITVTISGAQATHELILGSHIILNILGTYTVAQVSGFGGGVNITGGGQLDVTLFLMDGETIVDASYAKIRTMQPLQEGPDSELIVRNAGVVESENIDGTRGALTGRVEGQGSIWRHTGETAALNKVFVGAQGRVELVSAEGVFVQVGGGDAILQINGHFHGHGNILTGGRMNSTTGAWNGEGAMVIDGGTWVVTGAFTNEALTVRNGGELNVERMLLPRFGNFGSQIFETGGRLKVATVWKPGRGEITFRTGATVSCDEAQLSANVKVLTGATVTAKDNIFALGTIRVLEAGLLSAKGLFLADVPRSSAALEVNGPGSVVELTEALAVGRDGLGFLWIENQGEVSCQTAELGVSAGSSADARVSGAGSLWSINPAPGIGGLLIGDKGVGRLAIDTGGMVQVTSAAGIILARDVSGDGAIRLRDASSKLEGPECKLVIGDQGKGFVEVSDGAHLIVGEIELGKSAFNNQLSVNGTGTIAAGETVVGAGGRGSLAVSNGAQGEVGELRIGTEAEGDETGGTVQVDGSGTTMTVAENLLVGETHVGLMTITRGATVQVEGDELSVGAKNGGLGVLAVSGEDSSLTATNATLAIGVDANGTLEVSNGAVLVSKSADIGVEFNGRGEVIVGHTGATWTIDEDLRLGVDSGDGYLTIDDGGVVRANDGCIACDDASLGVAIITGKGSSLILNQGLRVGEGGRGATGVIGVHNGGSVFLA